MDQKSSRIWGTQVLAQTFALILASGGGAALANPLTTVLADFESGTTAGAVPATAANSSSGGASNSTFANVSDAGSLRLRMTDADGTYNGGVLTFSGAITQPGYYLITADVKVDNSSAVIGTFGMGLVAGSATTAKISDVNASYIPNLTGTGDAALGYQTIGAAINVPAGGTFPRNLTVYFGTDVSGNEFNASIYDGNYNGTHRGGAATWAAGSTNAVYIDNIKRIGPGKFGEERHLWISLGDGYTDLAKLDSLLVNAKQNNFNCVDILARYRSDAYYLPNRTDATYPNPEPLGTRVGNTPVSAKNDPLQYAIDRGHELGLKVYVSFSAFIATDGASGIYPSFLPSGSAMWFYNGGSPRVMTSADPSAEGIWADPARADVRAYLKNVVMDLITNYDIDGIIFDRIRYPTNTYSYNPQGLAEMGISGTPAPTNAAFREARRNAVTTFLHECYEAVTTAKPWLVVGTVPIAYGDSLNDTYNNVFQSWPQWTGRKTINRATSFGVCDLYQPQFYRLWNSVSPYDAPAANTRLMNKAQFGDLAANNLDRGLMPGASAIFSPLFYHPSSNDTNGSNANAQNITDGRALATNGFGFFSATPTLADVSLIRNPSASTAGVDVLASVPSFPDYLFKANYDNVAPNAVTNFAAAPQADGTVNLSWTAPVAASDGEQASRYLVYRSQTAGVKEFWSNLVTKATIFGSATSFQVPVDFAGTYYYRIVPVDDYNNRGPGREVGPVSVTGEPVPPSDIIVDNPQSVLTGTWSLATGAADKYGADYRYKGVGTGAATVRFDASLPAGGTWSVYEWHNQGSNRASNARHTITHGGGSSLVTVNQTVNGGKWNKMGDYQFSPATWSVTVDDNFSGTVIIADAMRWSYVVQPPAAPSGLTATATAASQTQINLSWTDNSNNERNTIVARSTASGGPYTTIATLGINQTSYTDSGLNANTTYYYVVRMVNSAGSSTNSAQASAATLPYPPAAPGSLAATAVSQTQINLTWTDNSTNETNFVVSRSTTAGGPYTEIATLGANVTSYSNTGLSAATRYYYIVRARNAGGFSGNSNEANALTLPNPPAAPSGLTATAASQTQINLAWTDNSTNETNFIVARSATAGGPYTDIATLGANVTSYSNTGLNANTTYFYVVRATNTGGASANSGEASAQTLLNPPTAPSGLSASTVSQSQINLTWTDNSTNETNFVVARSTTAGGPYTNIATLGANVTSFSNTGLAADTIYYYVVRATNSGGSSTNSNESNARTLPNPPAAPSGLTATAASGSQINLTWTDNSTNETNFIVSRSTTSGGPYTDIATLASNTTSFSNTGLTASTTYYYVVRATNSGGASANSAQASATTQADSTTIIIDNTAATMNGTWSLGTGATDKYGADYRFKGQGTGGEALTYTPNIATAGLYEVSEWHPAGTNRSAGTPHVISYNGASDTVLVNQQGNGGKWNLVGQFNFAAGTAGNVKITDGFADAGQVVMADAVRLLYLGAAAVPPTPTALTANTINSSRIDLSWTAVTNETGYTVARSTTSGGSYTNVATLGANVTSYSNTGLAANTTYYYVVRANNTAGSSANSVQASAKILAAAPAAPSTLAATAVSLSQINLTWKDNSTDEANFVVARSTTASGPYTNIATLGANVVSYSDTGLAANTRYYYVVRATSASGTSANSNEANALTWPATVTVDNTNSGFSSSTNWATATSAADKYGTDYRHRSTAALNDAANWNYSVPQSRNYQVYAWWCQGSNRSKTAPYVVYHGTTSTTASKNQQTSGGSWQSLGTFSLTAGSNKVALSCWTTTGYVVVADAVRIIAR